MARISTYKRIDGDDISSNDLMVGSKDLGIDINGPIYETRSYRLLDLQAFFSGGDFTASSPISIAIDASDGHRNWLHDTQSLTKQDPNPGITLYAKDNYGNGTTSNTPHIFSAITSVTTNTTGHLTNYTLTEFTMPEEYSFIVTGDDAVDHSNTGTNVDSVDQTINFEQTLTISGGDAWISTLSSNSDIVSIYHNNVSRNDVNNPSITLEHDSVFKAVSPTGSGLSYQEAILSDAKGHLSAEKITQYTLPDYKFNIAADSANSSSPAFTTVIDIHSTSVDTLSILASAPISSIITADDTITISHDEVSALIVTPATAEQPSFGGNFIALKSVDRNATGHLTHSIPVTVTIPNTLFTGPSGGNAGTIGLVPAPGTADGSKFLKGNGDWATIPNPSVMGSGNSYAAGLVLAGAQSHGNNFLRKDGSWATVTQTDVSSSNGTFVSLSALNAATGSVTIAPDLSAGGTPNSLTFLRGDNQWATPPGTYTLPIATSSIRGGIELRYDTNLNNSANAATSVAGRTYGLQLNSLNQAVINVPWTDNQLSTEAVQDIVGAMFSSNTETRISATYQDGDGTIDLAVDDMTANTQNTTTLSFVDSTNDIILRNTTSGAGSGSDDIKFVAGSNITLTHTDADNITIASTDTNTTYSANSGVDLAGTVFSLDVTSTTANSFFQIPFFNSAGNALSRDSSTSSSIFFNPNSNTLSVKQISIGTTSVINTRSIFSQSSNTSGNYFEIRSTMTNGTGGSVVIGVAGAANRIYSYNQTGSAGSSRNFEIVSSGGNTGDFIFGTNGNMTVSSGDVTADNFIVSSDKRLKSEIKPIKEGLNVIKQFSSYNYIKSGKKESGFIAQEVREVIPHMVYENNDGMLSMSDRGVVAHMHKAILELEERLIAIEEKLN